MEEEEEELEEVEEEKVVEEKEGKEVEVEVCGERNYGRASRSAVHLPQTIQVHLPQTIHPKAKEPNTMKATIRVRPRSQ